MKVFTIFIFLSFLPLFAQPEVRIEDLLMRIEFNPELLKDVRVEALKQNLPMSIYIPYQALIEAKGIENGKIVYAVITNFAHPEQGGYTAFYEEVTGKFDLSKARIIFADRRIIDNSNEKLQIHKATSNKLLLVPCWTYDRVMAFDYETGNLVDTAFIPTDAPRLQSPKHAIQKSINEILVSDQVSDAVQLYDTIGAFVKTFAPAGGVNNSILDNIRGIAFRPNRNLLVTNASGTAANRIQEFDSSGNFIGSFISSNVSSPFCILYRGDDILVSNSSGTYKILRFNLDGNFIAPFTTTTLNFVQQIIKNPDGTIVACEFSGTGTGLKIFDSTGLLITTLTGATGNRGVFRLPNGNYLTTNSSGIFEVDDTTGGLVRSIYVGGSLQYIDLFDRTSGNLMTANINYNEGWNLFSVPLTTIDMSIEQITPNRASNVFHYFNRYYTVDTLMNGQAYWVKYVMDTSITITGNLPLTNLIPVFSGWNLIGPYSTIVPVSSITSDPPDIITSLFYGFSNGYFTASELLPAKGYWVKVSQNGNLILPTTLVKENIMNEAVQILNDAGKLNFRDSKGKETFLYISKRQFENQIYQLPPIPPFDVFDVRFSTDNLMESLESPKIIKIKGAQYPVSITVEGVDIEIKDLIDGKIINTILKNGESLTIEDANIDHLLINKLVVDEEVQLYPNFPNPFNSSTTITFYLPDTRNVEIKIFDVLGREITTLLNELKPKGVHSIHFNSDKLSSGTYFVVLKTRDYIDTRKILLMK